MIFLLPVALLIGVMVLSGRRGDAAPAVSGAEATWNGATTSPLAVMCECLRAGKLPPPFVLQCAIAQAHSIGRPDLAQQIEQKFFGHPSLAYGSGFAKPTQPTPAAWFARALPVTQAQPIAPPAFVAPAAPVAQSQVQAVATPSPIPGVASGAYAEFARRLEREAPTFQSQRHVGRYRQNKQRLAEIGFDPEILVGAPDAQDAALFADVGDAYQHVVASGMADTLVGRAIVLPDTGADDEAPMVTLSGVLGVANVAGLDGAVEWFERKEDRKRYPHTTKAFQSTNGVF